MKAEIDEASFLINANNSQDTFVEYLAVGTLVVGGFCTALAASYKEVGVVNAIYIATGTAAAGLMVGVAGVALNRYGIFGCMFGANRVKVSKENVTKNTSDLEPSDESSSVQFRRME